MTPTNLSWMCEAEADAVAKIALAIQSSRGTDAEVSARHHDFIDLLTAWKKDRATMADARRAALESMIDLINAECKEWQFGDHDDDTKGTANEALSLLGCKVRALIDSAGRGHA